MRGRFGTEIGSRKQKKDELLQDDAGDPQQVFLCACV